jgi:hypothetical protein
MQFFIEGKNALASRGHSFASRPKSARRWCDTPDGGTPTRLVTPSHVRNRPGTLNSNKHLDKHPAVILYSNVSPSSCLALSSQIADYPVLGKVDTNDDFDSGASDYSMPAWSSACDPSSLCIRSHGELSCLYEHHKGLCATGRVQCFLTWG